MHSKWVKGVEEMPKNDDARWLDDAEQRAWRSFLALHREVMSRTNRQLQADSQLSGADYEVLVALSEAEGGRLRPYELVHALQWEQSRLSHHIGRMQTRGLVTRDECTADGRGSVIALTPCGRATIEAAAPLHVAAVRQNFFDHLSPEQVAALEDLAMTAIRALDAQESISECEQARKAGRARS
jgi:DNA-binding MarR family transcriptional regulator